MSWYSCCCNAATNDDDDVEVDADCCLVADPRIVARCLLPAVCARVRARACVCQIGRSRLALVAEARGDTATTATTIITTSVPAPTVGVMGDPGKVGAVHVSLTMQVCAILLPLIRQRVRKTLL